jgi:uncharacterized membrane protein YfhO
VRDAPNEVVIETESASPALLLLTDSYYPGWRASIYETPSTVIRANYAFRGVPVPAGRQVVAFRYEPASFRVGLYISLVAIALLSAWLTAAYLGVPDRASKTAERS